MKRWNSMNSKLKPAAAAVALALAAGPTGALQDFYLAAKAGTKDLPGGVTVPIWGYVEDPGGVCYTAASLQDRVTCIGTLDAPSLPGPPLEVAPGETDVRIFLSNGLPEPTSIVITGQDFPWSKDPNGPTWNNGAIGPRANASQRVRSFRREAAPDGGRERYFWTANPQQTEFRGPGSFVYHSGTWPQKQVYMGLSGLITQDAVAATAETPAEIYPGVTYDQAVTLFYSDIDPAFNDEVVATANTDGMTAINRRPSWFLINGEPFDLGFTPDLSAGEVGSETLLRLASTATDNHVVVLQGMTMTLHAEDGLQYNYQENGSSTAAPRVQYSAMLPPAKTKDAIIVAPDAGRFAVYDGDGYMTNPSDPGDEAIGDSVGGMLRFLEVAALNVAPTAEADDAITAVDTPLASIDVLANDNDPDGGTLTIDSFDAASAQNGSVACEIGIPGGTCSYTPPAFFIGVDTFTYTASDGAAVSDPATVTVSVSASGGPMYFSTLAGGPAGLVPDVGPQYDDADIYALGTAGFSRVVDASADWLLPLGADIDGMSINGTTVYLSFMQPTAVSVLGTVPAEDVVAYDTTTQTWSASFDGSQCGLDAATTNGHNIDAVHVDTTTGTVYFSIVGGGGAGVVEDGTGNPIGGPYDDADIYTWDGTNCARLIDADVDWGLPGAADIDGLSIQGGTGTYYVSFLVDTDMSGPSGNTLGIVQDESVLSFNGTDWNLLFDGTGLNTYGGQDLDAIHVSAP